MIYYDLRIPVTSEQASQPEFTGISKVTLATSYTYEIALLIQKCLSGFLDTKIEIASRVDEIETEKDVGVFVDD